MKLTPGGSVFISLEPMFNTPPASSENNAEFKSGQNRVKNNPLIL